MGGKLNQRSSRSQTANDAPAAEPASKLKCVCWGLSIGLGSYYFHFSSYELISRGLNHPLPFPLHNPLFPSPSNFPLDWGSSDSENSGLDEVHASCSIRLDNLIGTSGLNNNTFTSCTAPDSSDTEHPGLEGQIRRRRGRGRGGAEPAPSSLCLLDLPIYQGHFCSAREKPSPVLGHHRIIMLGRPQSSSNPNFNPIPPCPLNHRAKCPVHSFFEHFHGW